MESGQPCSWSMRPLAAHWMKLITIPYANACCRREGSRKCGSWKKLFLGSSPRRDASRAHDRLTEGALVVATRQCSILYWRLKERCARWRSPAVFDELTAGAVGTLSGPYPPVRVVVVRVVCCRVVVLARLAVHQLVCTLDFGFPNFGSD